MEKKAERKNRVLCSTCYSDTYRLGRIRFTCLNLHKYIYIYIYIYIYMCAICFTLRISPTMLHAPCYMLHSPCFMFCEKFVFPYRLPIPEQYYRGLFELSRFELGFNKSGVWCVYTLRRNCVPVMILLLLRNVII